MKLISLATFFAMMSGYEATRQGLRQNMEKKNDPDALDAAIEEFNTKFALWLKEVFYEFDGAGNSNSTMKRLVRFFSSSSVA